LLVTTPSVGVGGGGGGTPKVPSAWYLVYTTANDYLLHVMTEKTTEKQTASKQSYGSRQWVLVMYIIIFQLPRLRC
jgi:hypothetical protein